MFAWPSYLFCWKLLHFNVTFLFFKSYLISPTVGDEGAFFTNIFRKREVNIATRSVFIAWGNVYIYMTNRNTSQSPYIGYVVRKQRAFMCDFSMFALPSPRRKQLKCEKRYIITIMNPSHPRGVGLVPFLHCFLSRDIRMWLMC